MVAVFLAQDPHTQPSLAAPVGLVPGQRMHGELLVDSSRLVSPAEPLQGVGSLVRDRQRHPFRLQVAVVRRDPRPIRPPVPH